MEKHNAGRVAVVASVNGNGLANALQDISAEFEINLLSTPVLPVMQAMVADVPEAVSVIRPILVEMSYMLGKTLGLGSVILSHGAVRWYGMIGNQKSPLHAYWLSLRRRIIEVLGEDGLLVFQPYYDGIDRPYLLLAEEVEGGRSEQFMLRHEVHLERVSVIACGESDFALVDVLTAVPVI
jgi:hypothetical protein